MERIELDMGLVQVAQAPMMSMLGKLAGACEPSADSRFGEGEDTAGGTHPQTCGERVQDLGHVDGG